MSGVRLGVVRMRCSHCEKQIADRGPFFFPRGHEHYFRWVFCCNYCLLHFERDVRFGIR